MAQRAVTEASEPTATPTEVASLQIDRRIAELGGWRGTTLSRLRALIRDADPEIIEEVKWRGTPVWSRRGILCTGEAYRNVVKLTFAQGASLPDPHGLFNASLDGNTRRAIDIYEGESIDPVSFQALVRAAVARNSASLGPAKRAKKQTTGGVELLSGGNPRIAKGDGDAPVQAYIEAMPGWKREIGRRIDALVEAYVPGVRKAVKWNSPFYGVEGQGWFLSFHVFTRYVKVTFFNGLALQPVPPGGTPKSKDARWIDVQEHDGLDEKVMADWIRQAAALPGWVP